jgi:hypothetical protein
MAAVGAAFVSFSWLPLGWYSIGLLFSIAAYAYSVKGGGGAQ